MKHKLNFTMIILALLAFSNLVLASTYNTVEINTGLDVSQPGLITYTPSATQKDSFWKVISTPSGVLSSPVAPNVPLPNPAWAILPNSQYINAGSDATGMYEYERCFCLQNPEKAVLNLTLRADNQAEVFLNQYSPLLLQTSGVKPFASYQQAAIAKIESGFVAGKNCIRVRVKNDSGPTGMDLVAKVSGFGAQEIVSDCCRETKKLFVKK